MLYDSRHGGWQSSNERWGLLGKNAMRLGILALLIAFELSSFGVAADPAIGAPDNIGCRDDAKQVERLSIKGPGVYENIVVDGQWGDSTLVKITADDVTLRNCEIRNGKHNAVLVTGKRVVIEGCKIHHVLAGTYAEQRDAHGITGNPTNLTIRNCQIGLVSGDAIQFDPGRSPWDDVLVENCTLWTMPLREDAGGFKRGERPGENGVDTKQRVSNPRSKLTVRNCLFYGWNQPSQISNMAALNLKNHVQAKIENCLFRDNEICFRLRGGSGDYGGALVTVENCAVYESQVAVRAEDKIENVKIKRLGVAPTVKQKLVVAGGLGTGYELSDEFVPEEFEELRTKGIQRD